MKTKMIPKRKLWGTLLLLFTFLFASVSNGQSEYYYYYKGGKIGLELNTSTFNVSVFQNFQKDNLRDFKLKAYNLDKDVSQHKVSSLKYAEIEFQIVPSDAEYFKQLDAIKKTQNIRTVYPSFLSENGTEIGLSDYIYVKLQSAGDYRELEKKALEYDLTIVEQNKYMPLWYTLRCTENTDFSSLEVANRIFESELFASSVPDLMTYDDIECTNDPDFGDLWGLLNTTDPNADINACDAWAITEGNGINVAVLDQGIELTHIDLVANLSPLSYDTESDTSPSLIFGDHGTHCAGTIGAVGDNSTQVVGIAPECTLVSISNSLAGTPNSRQKRADGFNWAALNGVDVISNSWLSGVQYDVIDDAIDNALTNGRGGLGCIIVFAAGNGSGSPVSYPGNYTGAILAVGSITSTGARSGFSNIGAELDVVAPGSSILSTVLSNGTGYKSGTSMATPHVAGLAALILSVNPCLTGMQVNDIIEQSSQKSGGYVYAITVGRPNGTWNNEMGYGLIDAHAAVLLAQSVSCAGSCNTTVAAFPYSESFETDLGDWEQSTSDDFDWTRHSGSTTSSNTGPSSAADGLFYAYVESSFPNYPSKTTILNSPCFDLTGQNGTNLSFAYHMYGSTMGTLDLQVSSDGGINWTSEWSLSGDQGDQWSTANVDLSAYSGSTIQLRYVGTTSTSFRSDMAVDDISVTETFPCNTNITSFPYSESFETDFGDWEQVATDNFDWSRTSGTTPSASTGPSAAADGSFYAFVESSFPNYPGKKTILSSPCFDLTSQSNPNLSFAYHMYGASMGKLELEVSVDNGITWISLWAKKNDQGNQWLTASVDLNAYAGSVIQLRYVGTTNNSFQSDMAVDDIQITTLPCAGIVTSFPYTESFETDFGIWSQDLTEDFDWTRNSGSTSSASTGPDAANDGLWYAYTESSFPNNPFKSAHLNSPCIDLSGQSTVVFNFWYHMLGATMGTLAAEVTLDGGATWNTLFIRTGEQAKTWIPASINLSPYAGQMIQLRFVGKTINGFQSDMAIDDMSINVLKGAEKSALADLTGVLSDSPHVNIYPNPASDYAIVDVSTLDSDEISVSILDMLGKEVYSVSSVDGQAISQFRIPTSTFAPGSYMVVVKSNTGGTFNKKLIVRE